MPINKLKSLNNHITFGFSSLQNPSLLNDFYPPDLPQDWQLAYYCNEFHSLFVKLSTLIPSALEHRESKKTINSIIEAMLTYEEEVSEEDFILVFDLSDLPEAVEKKILSCSFDVDSRKERLFFRHDKIKLQTIDGCSTLFGWGSLFNAIGPFGEKTEIIENGWLCYLFDEHLMAPIELKKIIEFVNKQFLNDLDQVVVIFSSKNKALNNCQNAILLESMM
jgi:hypothetical protein